MTRKQLIILLLVSLSYWAQAQEEVEENATEEQPILELIEEKPVPAKPALLSKEDSLRHYLTSLEIEGVDTLDEDQIALLLTVLEQKEEEVQRQKEKEKEPLYGHHLFQRKDSLSLFRQSERVSIPAAYVLGTGDEITISIFGASQFDAQFEINEEGYIAPTKMPKIFLKGVAWGKAKELVRKRFNQFYRFRSDQFSMSLSEMRTITVHVLGEVHEPGSFNIAATNTAINALMLAGGPTDKGSVRSIRVTRGTKEINIDLYELINQPSLQINQYLQDNDIIQVPVAQKVVAIDGAINRPLRYELKKQETLADLLLYAGGLRLDAYLSAAQLTRYEDGRQVIIDLDLEKQQGFPLLKGDGIWIRQIPQKVENVVYIEGAVEQEGGYGLSTTKTVAALIRKSKLTRAAKMEGAFLVRTKPDSTNTLLQFEVEELLSNPNKDIILQPLDKVIIQSQKNHVTSYGISVMGAVRDSLSDFRFDPDSTTITLQQAIVLAGGLLSDAKAEGYVLRTDLNNLNKKEYLKVDIKEAMRNGASAANIALQPLDEIIVLKASTFSDTLTVSIMGAVHHPDTFAYAPSLSIGDVIQLAGGFTTEAAKNKVDVYRLELNKVDPTKTVVITLELDDAYNIVGGASPDFRLAPFDVISVRTLPDFEKQAFVSLRGEVVYPGEYALTEKNETIYSLLKRAGGLSEDAFARGTIIKRNDQLVVTQLDEVLKNPTSKYNVYLEKGDTIQVPKMQELVTIRIENSGAANIKRLTLEPLATALNVAFEPNKTAKWYINEYVAGFEEGDFKKYVTVEYANGALKKAKSYGFFKSFPKVEKGATIIIGNKPVPLRTKQNENVATYPKLKKGVIIAIDPNTTSESPYPPK